MDADVTHHHPPCHLPERVYEPHQRRKWAESPYVADAIARRIEVPLTRAELVDLIDDALDAYHWHR